MKNIILISLVWVSGIVTSNAQQIDWKYSTPDKQWQTGKKNEVAKLKDNSVSADIVITGEKRQYIDGFGGCFNEMGWDALMSLSEPKRQEIINDLFSPQGANFNYCRMSMGASDYGLSFYSFNDTADDFNMVNFNIDRDRYIMIPYIKAAQAAQPDLKVWGSPWSPPAWMKTNNHYASNANESGWDNNGLPREKILELPTTGFKMQRGYLEAYALYFTKYIKAYEAEGIPIQNIHVQNEPCSNHTFPSCNWRSEDLAYFIGGFLGPKFEEENIEAEIFFGTINRDNPAYTRTALEDPKAAKYIKGVGFQWDGKYAIPTINKEYPHLKMMQTESECGNGSNDWGAAEYTWGLINHYLNNGVRSYAYWNMVLDHTGESNWGWVQNMLISVNKDTKEVIYNPEYYIMKHLSHYVVPGAHLLSTSGGDDHLAFVNPDNTIVLILVNKDENDKKKTISVKDELLSVNVQGKSFNTFYIK